MKRVEIIEVIVFLYAALFLYTGISKLMEYSVFKDQIAESPILAPIALPLAAGLPWLEFAVTALLIVPRWRLQGFYASFILMTLFTLYIIGILLFNEKLPCSCGGILQQLSWSQHLIFNGIFIVLAIMGMVLQNQVTRYTHKGFGLKKKNNMLDVL
jgi:uncharacterized membrane protein YphA (DoxX/SURF4 family)